jgi:predicted dehydrogenase
VIARPDWSAEMADAAMTGGPAVDLHIHDTHFVGLLCGVPAEVSSHGVVNSGTVSYLTTAYRFGPGGPAVTCSSGAVAAAGRPFVHGFEIYLEGATLAYGSGGPPLTVYLPDGTQQIPEFAGGGDPLAAFADEIAAAAEAVRSGIPHPMLRGQLARDALVLCQRECQSVLEGRPVAV